MAVFKMQKSVAAHPYTLVSFPGKFCNFGPTTLAAFNALGRPLSLAAGTVLMREHDPANQVVAICTGQVKLLCSSREGKTLYVKIASPGDMLGLGAAIMGSTLEVTAITLKPSTFKLIPRADFVAFLHSHDEASWNATYALAKEHKSAFAGARSLALSASVASRVARILLDLARATPIGAPELCFQLSLTHDELAEFASTSRETVTRTLGKFQKDKLIHIRGAEIQILLPDRLADLVA